MHIYHSQKNPIDLFTHIKSLTQKMKTPINNLSGEWSLTTIVEPLVNTIRYNPYRDTGHNGKCYFLSNNKNETDWNPPNNPDLIIAGFPLWVSVYGFADYIKKTQKQLGLDNEYIFVFTNESTIPKHTLPWVILDHNFINATSPYLKERLRSDENKWYPQLQFQTKSINDIALCGPGAPKLDGRASEEIKAECTFYFKFGGCPPKIPTVSDPAQEEIFPIPRNEHQTTSLQNPAMPIEYYVSHFDWRRHELTDRAAKRLKKDYDTEKTLFEITGTSKEVPVQTQQETDPSSEEEESEKNLLEQLQHHRIKQQRLRQRIQHLLTKLQTIE